jgi:putative transport protein
VQIKWVSPDKNAERDTDEDRNEIRMAQLAHGIAEHRRRLGHIGSLVWYMPASANTVLRELGIVLFLACVGLKAGAHFLDVLLGGDGLIWMAAGAAITLVPLLVVGATARLISKLNFMSLCGVLAGAMTDPPALAFANAVGRSDAPSVAYATVYPLAMLLRIIVAQVMVLLFSR